MNRKKDHEVTLTKEQLLNLLSTMLLIRNCEEQLVKSYARGDIPGGMHMYIGEEAVATGVCAHLKVEDAVFSTHRGHGHALAKGMKPERMIAEVMGKALGCCGGRGGSMHLFEPSVGFYGTSGIVGPSILLATGAGYKAKLQGSECVGVAFFGDGGSNNGAFHEGINLASAWSLPVVYVCENNLYATEVPLRTITKSPSVAERAYGLGLPGVQVDGQDVLAVHKAAGEAIARARRGEGPTLIECLTYRYRAHAEGMRETGYRTAEEIEQWKMRDPINSFKERLLAMGTFDSQDFVAFEQSARQTAEQAADFARKSPLPDPETLTDYVFSEAQHA